mmetsp:Transcript_15163/g.21084  ORF Transcript_15163/g.21084 Transcript_15163/m.21084 type:complete len:142 (+) Transcript_15163:1015-1440(+)
MSAFKVRQEQLRYLQPRWEHQNVVRQDSSHRLRVEPIQTFSPSQLDTNGRRQRGNESLQKGASSLFAFQGLSTCDPEFMANPRSGDLKTGNRTTGSSNRISVDRQSVPVETVGQSEVQLFKPMTAEQDKFKNWDPSFRSNK